MSCYVSDPVLNLRVRHSRIARPSTCRRLDVRSPGKQIGDERALADHRTDIEEDGHVERCASERYDADSKKHIRDSRFYRVAEKFWIFLFSTFAFTSATFTVPDSSSSTTARRLHSSGARQPVPHDNGVIRAGIGYVNASPIPKDVNEVSDDPSTGLLLRDIWIRTAVRSKAEHGRFHPVHKRAGTKDKWTKTIKDVAWAEDGGLEGGVIVTPSVRLFYCINVVCFLTEKEPPGKLMYCVAPGGPSF